MKLKKKFKSERLSLIEAEIEEIKIDKEVMVPSEEVILSMTRHGYIKRTSFVALMLAVLKILV